MTTIHQCGTRTVTLASATRVGGRDANADAAAVVGTPLGVGAAVIDGIGSSPAVVAAAQLAACTAAVVAAHRGAQAGIMAAADTYPDYPGAPNAVGAVVSVEPGGRIEIAHVGDCAVWTWSKTGGLTRWTVDQTAGQHVTHMLGNPGLTELDRAALAEHGDQVVGALADYVLNGLVFATISTISWTPLRGPAGVADLVLLTSDGVHKALPAARIAELAETHVENVQALADALVDVAVTEPRADPDETADNATAAVIRLA
ncbi:hypothetical protein OOK41_08915 [Micromonospora sp. NBC_01655]|uniref:hypothetical protein n=1 Tax=Micromonospora sp. NBC_01655 TaxID=2975983 RepID=UPI002252EFC0|nr:hypothetical protein [Micromonospora sp. NBC_01655]MCX4470425.1 hypothetical protein [Micromonospora sp. NBC_01655]